MFKKMECYEKFRSSTQSSDYDNCVEDVEKQIIADKRYIRNSIADLNRTDLSCLNKCNQGPGQSD